MPKVSSEEAFYRRLKQQLQETSTWPSTYVFKFILPTAGNTQELLKKLFDNDAVKLTSRASSKGKYTSISISGTFENPDSVIEKHRQAAKIPNIIQL